MAGKKKFSWPAFIGGAIFVAHIIAVICIGACQTMDYAGGIAFGASSLVAGAVMGIMWTHQPSECPEKRDKSK